MYHKEALHHVLFWRPEATHSDLQAWYDNPGARTALKALDRNAHAYRWGSFIERIQDDKLGRTATGIGSSLNRYLRRQRDQLRELLRQANAPDDYTGPTTYYIYCDLRRRSARRKGAAR
jgi:hypothetical protein